MKRLYKTCLLKELSEKTGVTTFLQRWTLFKACNLIADCWNSIPTSTLKNSWNKLLRIHLAIQNCESQLDSSETESATSSIRLLAARIPGSEDYSMQDINDWISDRGARTFHFFSQKNIARKYGTVETSSSDEDDEEVENEVLQKEFDDADKENIPISVLVKATKVLSIWAANEPQFSPEECALADKMKKMAIDKMFNIF